MCASHPVMCRTSVGIPSPLTLKPGCPGDGHAQAGGGFSPITHPRICLHPSRWTCMMRPTPCLTMSSSHRLYQPPTYACTRWGMMPGCPLKWSSPRCEYQLSADSAPKATQVPCCSQDVPIHPCHEALGTSSRGASNPHPPPPLALCSREAQPWGWMQWDFPAGRCQQAW